MIQCMACKKWCRKNCAGVKNDKYGFFASTSNKVISLK